MFYILHKPYGTNEPWLELPHGIRSEKEAREKVKILISQKKEDGSRMVSVRLCVGRGRDRRDILRL